MGSAGLTSMTKNVTLGKIPQFMIFWVQVGIEVGAVLQAVL